MKSHITLLIACMLVSSVASAQPAVATDQDIHMVLSARNLTDDSLSSLDLIKFTLDTSKFPEGESVILNTGDNHNMAPVEVVHAPSCAQPVFSNCGIFSSLDFYVVQRPTCSRSGNGALRFEWKAQMASFLPTSGPIVVRVTANHADYDATTNTHLYRTYEAELSMALGE